MDSYLQDQLAKHIGPGPWRLEKPGIGFGLGRTLIAHAPSLQVVILVDGPVAAIRAAAVAGLTPPIMAELEPREGQRFLVQQYVQARHPDEGWYEANNGLIAHQLARLQRLSTLADELPKPACDDFQSLLSFKLNDAEGLFQQIPPGYRQRPDIEDLLTQIRQRSANIQGAGLVPSHGDLQGGNILITETGIYFIDWEHVALSDPVRDPAQLLWWSVPSRYWPGFLAQLNLDWQDRGIQERFFLHASLLALSIHLALLVFDQGHEIQRFLEDASRALQHRRPRQRLVDWDALG